MSRKTDGTERSGRGTAPPAAGGFGGADTALTRLARPFTPKPFRSTGGMSASADTMMSIGMGRHQPDDEIPDDQVNIPSIVSRKTSDRRYLPRKLGNMKKYLHTTPLNEAMNLTGDEIRNRHELFEFSLMDFGRQLYTGAQDALSYAFGEKKPETQAGSALAAALPVAASFIPFAGEIQSGYLAYKNFEEIRASVLALQNAIEGLPGHRGEIKLFDSPEVNEIKLRENQAVFDNLPPYVRDSIKASLNKIAAGSVEFLTNLVKSVPLEVIPSLGIFDSIIDSAISAGISLGSSYDPSGESTARAFYSFVLKATDQMRRAEEILGDILPGEDFAQEHEISNLFANLALVFLIMKSSESPLSELRKRKKHRTDEFSGAGAIVGYTGPVKGPEDPEHFYDTMAHAVGGEYLVDPVKNSKAKP